MRNWYWLRRFVYWLHGLAVPYADKDNRLGLLVARATDEWLFPWEYKRRQQP